MLTDTKLRALRPKERAYRVADSAGLCIEVTPAGSKLWRYRFRHNGKASMLAVGPYPETSLADARKARDEARAKLRAGVSPVDARKRARRVAMMAAGNTLRAIANEWLEKQKHTWTVHHAADVLRSLEQDAFPAFGSQPISSIHPTDVVDSTLLFALYRMGCHSRATTHGFRALASTTLNEQGWHPDVIERQLAHAQRNKVRAAYNRAQYLAERTKMVQAWADYLEGLRTGAKVVPIKRRT
jgi:Arm domain-containing DNA-binding protein/integrase-like protein